MASHRLPLFWDAERERDAAMRAASSTYINRQKQNKAANDAEQSRQDAAFAMQDKQAGYRAGSAQLRASGDFEGAERLERQARREEGQFRASNAGPAEAAAYKKQAAAEDEIENESESFRRSSGDFSSSERIANTRSSASEAAMRMAGRTRQAGDAEFTRGLQEEIAAKDQAAQDPNNTNSRRAAAESQALRDAMPTRMAERQQDENRRQEYEASRSSDRVDKSVTDTISDRMRAGGNVRGASNFDYERALESRIKSLDDAAEAEKDGTKKEELLTEAKVERVQKESRIAARTEGQLRQDTIESSSINSAAQSNYLRAEGRSYEAGINQRDTDFQAMVNEARANGKEDVARALENKWKSAADLDNRRHRREVGQIREEALVDRLRNQHQGKTADVIALKQRIDRELDDASGDVEKQRAIRERAIEESRRLEIGEAHAAGSQQDEYINAFGDALSSQDRGRAQRSAKNLRQGLEYENKHPNANATRPDAPGANAVNAGAMALTASAGALGNAVGKFQQGADKWDTIADKINNAPTLVVGDFA